MASRSVDLPHAHRLRVHLCRRHCRHRRLHRLCRLELKLSLLNVVSQLLLPAGDLAINAWAWIWQRSEMGAVGAVNE